MSERTEPIRVTYNVVIVLCKRDLKLRRPPTAKELSAWAAQYETGRECVPGLTVEQAAYMLEYPDEFFATT